MGESWENLAAVCSCDERTPALIDCCSLLHPHCLPPPGVAASNVANPLSNFTKVKKLGEGGFGKVYLVQDHRDGQQYVMKEIDLSKLDAKGRRESIKECAFLARMAHPNIISYKEWFEVAGPPPNAAGPWGPQAWKGGPPPQGGKNSSTLYICMSYADGGDLEARIKVQQKLSATGRFHPFPEQQIIDWFIQTALAIKHIHDRKILHRLVRHNESHPRHPYFLRSPNSRRSSPGWLPACSSLCSSPFQGHQIAEHFPDQTQPGEIRRYATHAATHADDPSAALSAIVDALADPLVASSFCPRRRFRHRARSQQHDGEGDDSDRSVDTSKHACNQCERAAGTGGTIGSGSARISTMECAAAERSLLCPTLPHCLTRGL